MKNNQPVTQVERPFPKGKYIVSRTDLKGIITYANTTFIELSGFTEDELIGKNHNVLRHPDMPPAAFKWLWDTVKAGRPWRGIVKNRCKNGDHYWVEALVVPVRKNDQTIGYMSVRTEPSKQQVSEAEALYAKLNAGQATIPGPSLWQRTSMTTKLNMLIGWLILAQLLGAVAHQFGSVVGLSTGQIETLLQVLGVSSLGAGVWLFTQTRFIMTIMGRIVGRLDHIAQGDLTDTIPIHRVDELGQLNDAVIAMQTHMKSM